MGQANLAFRGLLAATPGLMPGEIQKRASELLPARVAESRMHWWTVGDEIRTTGRRLLIGVAVWSGYDLRLLDYVDAALVDSARADLSVDVFDVDAVRPPNPFEPYVPGLGEVYQTPVVGLWVDGRLEQRGAGYDGRKIVADLFGFDVNDLVSRQAAPAAR